MVVASLCTYGSSTEIDFSFSSLVAWGRSHFKVIGHRSHGARFDSFIRSIERRREILKGAVGTWTIRVPILLF